ncbi:MAG: phosphoribosylamine--glycine ligase [Dissulfurimicrobium sp.]|uniref:phosphoribosylamine--glycine ligase n=1 Tax=Dissulfurimicrobium sp. TaxID=2022436 RepID=UPI00404A5463
MIKKKVLVIGSGGREHAIIWKLAQSPGVKELFCAPGNGGISRYAACIPVEASDIEGLIDFVKSEGIDLTVVGPEAPLVFGITDRFRAEGLSIFGPSRLAAELEGSKAFAKDLLSRAGIPTASYKVFTEPGPALDYIREKTGTPVVLKANGLAAGKGVIIAHNFKEAQEAVDLILCRRVFGEAGESLVVEEFLSGEEASFMVVTDGKTVLPLATSQDHKAILENDQGPNTGGMGAYSPAPVVTEKIFARVMDNIMIPVVRAMQEMGRPYQGILYAGLMIDGDEVKVLEFNCRFGDPEAQSILMRLKSDLLVVFEAAVAGCLDKISLEWDPRPAVCVVMASGGYPGKYETGKTISGLDDAGAMEDVMVFHAGTALSEGRYVTAGGRVLGITAIGKTISDAISLAYEAAGKISWDGVYYRKDIGQKALRHIASQEGAPSVGIVMGSISDREIMEETKKMLSDFCIPCELKVLSAHRSPELVSKYAKEAEAKGIKVLIAGAGMAAHLAGTLAAHTNLPVIGVPINSSPLNGLDALLSTVQMPPGVPVATMSIGKAGAKNAAILAMQILALNDSGLNERLKAYKEKQTREIARLNNGL